VAIVGAPAQEEQLLRRQIGDLMPVVGTAADTESALSLVRDQAPTIALIYLDADPRAMLALSAQLVQAQSCAPVIVSRDRDPDQILRAMRAGARDFAYVDEEGMDVRRVLLEHSLHVQQTIPTTHLGKLIVLFSCKGGSGCTTIATNLAGALLPEGRPPAGEVALLDLDFQMGDVLAFLDLASRYTWQDVVRNQHRLDEDLLHKSLTIHPRGLHVVAQSDALEDADDLSPKAVGSAIALLRRHFDFCVVDGVRDFSELSLLALDLADLILLTVTQDVPALKNASRCLKVFRQLGYDQQKVQLVLNRYQRRSELQPDTIGDALNLPVAATVANDFPTVVRAINEGALLIDTAPRAAVTRDILQLTALVRGEQVPRKRGLFRLRGRGAELRPRTEP